MNFESNAGALNNHLKWMSVLPLKLEMAINFVIKIYIYNYSHSPRIFLNKAGVASFPGSREKHTVNISVHIICRGVSGDSRR